MSETWQEAVERAMNDAPEAAKAAWRRLRAAEAEALRKGAALLTEAFAAPPQREVTTDIDRLVDEREGLRKQVDDLERQVRTLYNDGARVATERDALKARLEATERKAAEVAARVEALTAEVRDHEWRARGSPMAGEPTTPGASPFDGHPFVPMPERPTVCVTCGYSDQFVSTVAGMHPKPREEKLRALGFEEPTPEQRARGNLGQP